MMELYPKLKTILYDLEDGLDPFIRMASDFEIHFFALQNNTNTEVKEHSTADKQQNNH